MSRPQYHELKNELGQLALSLDEVANEHPEAASALMASRASSRAIIDRLVQILTLYKHHAGSLPLNVEAHDPRALASSWHPWSYDGKPQLPIQEDSTAWCSGLYGTISSFTGIWTFIKPLYRSLVKKAADFMCQYRDEETRLPAPCFDLWEERRGIFSFKGGRSLWRAHRSLPVLYCLRRG